MADPRWLDETEQHAWRSYLTMQSQLSAQLNRELQRVTDLSLPDFEVLVRLTEAPDERIRVSELAKQLQWEKSRLSHHLGRMQKRGLVNREECPSDARGAFIVITPCGHRAIDEAAPLHVATVRRLVFDGLTRTQVENLGAIADEVLTRLAAES